MSSFCSYSAFHSFHSPTQELNFRQLSLPTNSMSAGMFSSNMRGVQFETKTWGQTSCFTSQHCPGRHTHAIHNMPPPQDLGMKHLHRASLQEMGIWLECPYGTLQLCTLKVHSAVLVVSHIINSTHQRFAFHAYYFEHRPSNIPRLGDATVSLTYLCMREGKRSQKIKSVPWLLTWLV